MSIRASCPCRCLLLLSLSFVSGCGRGAATDYKLVTLVPAAGTVSLDGEPLAEAVVIFEADDGQFSFAQTDAKGRYALQFDSVKPGVTPGRKIVRIRTSLAVQDRGEEWSDVFGLGEKVSAPERVPARYNVQSELTVEVTSRQRRYDFQLVSP